MKHEFVILLNGKLKTYHRYEDIPKKFDNVIKFAPQTPKPPHTDHQHEEMDSWNDRLKELLKRETNGNKS